MPLLYLLPICSQSVTVNYDALPFIITLYFYYYTLSCMINNIKNIYICGRTHLKDFFSQYFKNTSSSKVACFFQQWKCSNSFGEKPSSHPATKTLHALHEDQDRARLMSRIAHAT